MLTNTPRTLTGPFFDFPARNRGGSSPVHMAVQEALRAAETVRNAPQPGTLGRAGQEAARDRAEVSREAREGGPAEEAGGALSRLFEAWDMGDNSPQERAGQRREPIDLRPYMTGPAR